MVGGFVTTVEEALAASGNCGATTLVGPELEQRAVRLAPGERRALRSDGRCHILFTAAGAGTLRVAGEEHALRPETGAFVGADEEAALECSEDAPLLLLVVLAPVAAGTSARVVHYDDRQAEDAGIGREFRLLAGCSAATQFVGVVPPGRANFHNHPYDELAYVVEGAGVLHWKDGPSVPVGAGSCIRFPRLAFHSLENTGETDLRIMGVFHPAGSPADRVEVLDH